MKTFIKNIGCAFLTAVLSLCAFSEVSAQGTAVEGSVFDALGRPVGNVAILSTDGQVLGVTDSVGLFLLAESYTGPAVLKKDGYRTMAVSLRPGNVNNFRLDANLLNEDIAVGYGFQKRSQVISGISSVSSDVIMRSSVSYPSYALYGILPGLVVEDQSERIGTDVAPNFFIRGKATFGNASNLPLVMVDGFIRDIDDVNINDIASVNVLKDAAATALYGMRGANGVVLIETKRGELGKPRYKIDFEQGFQTPVRIPGFVNSARYAQYYNEALNNDGMSPKYSLDQIEAFHRGRSIYTPDNQWQKELVRDITPTTKVNASATGGSNIARYYVSLGYRRDNGLFKYTDRFSEDYDTNPSNDRFFVKTNLDITAIENLDLKLDIGGQINTINLPRTDQSELWNSFYSYPQNEFPMLLPDGSLGGTASFPDNPYGKLNCSGYRKTLNRFIQSSLVGEYHMQGVLKGLSFGGKYAYDNQWIANEYWDRTFAINEITGRNEDNSPILVGRGIDGELTYRHNNTDDSQRRRETIEGFVKYIRDFGCKHHLDATFIYHRDNLKTDNGTPYRNQYWAGRVNYNYQEKYLAELVLSYSGSEAFARKNRYEAYPAVAFGWVISKEGFLRNSKVVDFLKIRTSVGYSGNSELNARFTYRQQSTWYGDNYYFGETPNGYDGRALSTEANPNLRAEKALKYDAGIETQLFSSLYFSGGYFFERRYNILTDLGNQFSGVTGLAYPNINKGSTHTHGFELQLNYDKQISRDWTLWGDFSMLWYRNQIKSMLEMPLPEDSAYQYQTGHQIGATLGLIAQGIFQDQDEIDNNPVQQFGAVAPGDIRYKDVNGDGVVNDYDRVYSNGYSIPNTDIGLRLGAKFRNFDLFTFIHVQLGTEIYMGDASAVYWPFANNSYRVSEYVNGKTPWTLDRNAMADYPKLSTTTSANNYRRSSFWLVDGDRLRLKTFEIGYTLPERVASKLHMSSFRIYLRGMNLLTLDHLKDLDPAALTGMPMLRSYYIGCSITF